MRQGHQAAASGRMAVYFAKYGAGAGKESQHKVPPQWLAERLRRQDRGTDYPEHGEDDFCPPSGSYSVELGEAPGTGQFWGTGG